MSDDSYKFESGVVPTIVVKNQTRYLESTVSPYRALYGTAFHRRSISEWSTEGVYGGSTVDQRPMTDYGFPYYKTLCYNMPKVHRSHSGSSNAVLSNDSYPMDLNHIPTFVVQRQTGDLKRSFEAVQHIVYDRVYDYPSPPPRRTHSKLARTPDPKAELNHQYSYVANDGHFGKQGTASEVSCPQTNVPRSCSSSSTVESSELSLQPTNKMHLFCLTECRRFFCLLLIFLAVFLIVVLVINYLNEKSDFGTSVVAVTILLWCLALLCTVITSHLLMNAQHTEEDIT